MNTEGGKAFLVLLLFAVCLVSAGAGESEESPRIRALREALQENVVNLPEISVNSDLGNARFNDADLGSTRLTVAGASYCAFKFKTPRRISELVLGFRVSEGLRRWYVMPARGRPKGFGVFIRYDLPRDIPGFGNKGERYIVQRIQASDLSPEDVYIICFEIDEGGDQTVCLSLNVSPQVSFLAYHSIFPELFSDMPAWTVNKP